MDDTDAMDGTGTFVRSAAEARPGQLLLECRAPNRASSHAFDLHPDGSLLVVGTVPESGYGAEFHVVDVATGEQRLVHAEAAGARQAAVHAVLFDTAGTGLVYAVDGRTCHVDLGSGAVRELAAYEQGKTASFNPYCLRPQWDAARQRLLLFDAGDAVRVVAMAGPEAEQAGGVADLCRLSTRDDDAGPAATEVRAAALSRDGSRLALHRVSRGIVYGHDDAAHDTTNEVELRDVDTGVLLRRIPLPAPLHTDGIGSLGFAPDGTSLVADPEPAQGPCGIDAESGRLLWAFPHAHRNDRWDECFGWAYSPAGDLLAVGRYTAGRGITLHDAGDRSPYPLALERVENQRVMRLVFAADGTRLAAGGSAGMLTVRAI
ncbi:WD40 repeat domain-containing protein [Yinghuangia soli]|uniref:WD40 repeat domain-containing protein n=1 Tax=Yinghuangia soli TaxID=2908204 RepID=A0AA41PTZ0_9ACTN|nr:WD40 repeat domain-containing protein [Yinghuangia soli]MCF2525833.1 WD40 repeat domain-containing protein [Yinghuangia soli]